MPKTKVPGSFFAAEFAEIAAKVDRISVSALSRFSAVPA
jgi:hypothetical protein